MEEDNTDNTKIEIQDFDSITRNTKKQRVTNSSAVISIIKHIDSHMQKSHDKNYQLDDSQLKESLSKLIYNIPFVKQLSNLQVSHKNFQIPIISKQYESRFMRECISSSEKKCSMMEQCECMFIDKNKSFIGTRFLIPGIPDNDLNMCVICLRKTTQLLYYKSIFHGYDIQRVIQKYGNICNEENEYHPSAMLACNPDGPIHCMPLPIVAHQRNRYEVVEVTGIKYLKQIGVHMTDFR